MAEIGPHFENEQSRLHLLYLSVLPTLTLSSGLKGEVLQGTCKEIPMTHHTLRHRMWDSLDVETAT